MGYTYCEVELDDETVEVEFLGDVYMEDQGIGEYEYWGHKEFQHDYRPVCDKIWWSKESYSMGQNELIQKFLDNNFDSIVNEIIEHHDEEENEPPEKE